MMRFVRTQRRPFSVIALCAVALSLTGCTGLTNDVQGIAPAISPTSSNDNVMVTGALADLSTLKVIEWHSVPGYSRDLFGETWAETKNDTCNVRNDILTRDMTEVTYADRSKCKVATGLLHDPYSGKDIQFTRGNETSADVQIDHVVALADAWRNGASAWSSEKRFQFANDPAELQAVSDAVNKAKGSKNAYSWLPPNESYQCTYVARQISIKKAYGLSVSKEEASRMREVLLRCR